MGNKIDKPKQTASQLVAKMKHENGNLFEYTSEKEAEIYLTVVSNYLRTAA